MSPAASLQRKQGRHGRCLTTTAGEIATQPTLPSLFTDQVIVTHQIVSVSLNLGKIVPWSGPKQLRFKLNLGKRRPSENFTWDVSDWDCSRKWVFWRNALSISEIPVPREHLRRQESPGARKQGSPGLRAGSEAFLKANYSFSGKRGKKAEEKGSPA